MEFIKHFNQRGGHSSGDFKGAAVFSDGFLTIRLPNTKAVVEKGYIDGGFGVVTKDVKPKKSPYIVINTEIDKEYLPVELRGETYKFRIEAEYLSENEIVFPYSRARMMNKK